MGYEEENTAFDKKEEDTCCKRFGKCCVSAILASLYGVLVAEVVANSMVEMSYTPVFSIVFGVAFFILGLAILYRTVTTPADALKRGFMILFGILVFGAAGSSVVLQRGWLHFPAHIKTGMYADVGLCLAFALTFSFTEFMNMGICDNCCHTSFGEKPLISKKSQMAIIFLGSAFMGVALGVMFGVIDVENDDKAHDKFDKNLIISLPLGAIVGLVIGFINQFLRSAPDAITDTIKYKQIVVSYSSHDDDI